MEASDWEHTVQDNQVLEDESMTLPEEWVSDLKNSGSQTVLGEWMGSHSEPELPSLEQKTTDLNGQISVNVEQEVWVEGQGRRARSLKFNRIDVGRFCFWKELEAQE